MRYFKIPWNRKGQKRVEEEERLVNTSRRREKRRKAQEASTVNFGPGMHCVSSLFRENSQLKSEKLWEQVIHLVQKYLNCVPKYIILSTKIYNLVHKCIF